MRAMTTPARTAEVVPGLHRIDLGPVNAYLLDTGDGPVLVDTGFPGDELRVLGALAELAVGPASLRAIVLTHAHPDHAGGAAELRAVTGAPIHMHPHDAELVRTGRSGRPLTPAPGFEDVVPDAMLSPFPIAPFEPDEALLPGGPVAGLPGVTVLGAPGHCAGQVVLRWNRHGGVLVAADAAAHTAPVPTLARVCEDPAAATRTFQRLHRLAVEVAVFGHGDPIGVRAGETLRAAGAIRAGEALRAGQALDERQASRSLTALPVRSTPPS
jgi:glyoxylase-like metal-dependent hydrolase (beta-lactamase superfamily II)